MVDFFEKNALPGPRGSIENPQPLMAFACAKNSLPRNSKLSSSPSIRTMLGCPRSGFAQTLSTVVAFMAR